MFDVVLFLWYMCVAGISSWAKNILSLGTSMPGWHWVTSALLSLPCTVTSIHAWLALGDKSFPFSTVVSIRAIELVHVLFLLQINNQPVVQQRVSQQMTPSQSQQLVQQIQRQRQQPVANSVVPQPIILNQGTQNVQVVHPLQRQQPMQTQQMAGSQQTMQRVGQSQSSVSDETKAAARLKVQQILNSMKNGNTGPEEKKKLLMILKVGFC